MTWRRFPYHWPFVREPTALRTRDEDDWCFLWGKPKRVVQQTFELLVIRDLHGIKWRHCNGMIVWIHEIGYPNKILYIKRTQETHHIPIHYLHSDSLKSLYMHHFTLFVWFKPSRAKARVFWEHVLNALTPGVEKPSGAMLFTLS